jgi:thiol:disulfide interchange protein DsbD
MSMPFLLLSVFPIRILPKPGPWLLFVKPSLGFVLIVTVLWLLQIYTALTSLDHFLVISTVLVGMAYILWLWGQQLVKGWIALILSISIISVGVVQTLQRPLTSIPYSETVVTQTINDGKNVLIYATAKWCLTCKMNAMILQKESVQQALKDSNTALIMADYTKQDEDITLLLRKHNLAGVPATILLKGDKAIILPEILTESGVLTHLSG